MKKSGQLFDDKGKALLIVL